jgi:hypothetical protein
MATISLTSTASAVSSTTATLVDGKVISLTSSAAAVATPQALQPYVLNVLGEIGKTSVPFFDNSAP